jgi:hypothetical protein
MRLKVIRLTSFELHASLIENTLKFLIKVAIPLQTVKFLWDLLPLLLVELTLLLMLLLRKVSLQIFDFFRQRLHILFVIFQLRGKLRYLIALFRFFGSFTPFENKICVFFIWLSEFGVSLILSLVFRLLSLRLVVYSFSQRISLGVKVVQWTQGVGMWAVGWIKIHCRVHEIRLNLFADFGLCLEERLHKV